MALTQMESRCPQRFSTQAPIKVRPLVKRQTPRVPEAKVKEMLREMAFVLHVTRQLSKEIREPKDCAGARQG